MMHSYLLSMLIPLLAITTQPQFSPATASADSKLIESKGDPGSKPPQDPEKWSSKDIATIVAPLVSLIGVGLVVYYTRRNVISEQWLKTNQAESEYLQRKLDEFYGPFMLLSDANHLTAQDLRNRQPSPGEYRLLDKLFDDTWRSKLSEGDKTIVEDICNTGPRLRRLITRRSGIVDPAILPYLARAMAHFRMLYLAHEKKLGPSSAPFLRYVYPKTLDPVLKLEVARLRDRLRLLRQDPTSDHGDLAPLDLSKFPLPPWPNPSRPDFVPGRGLVAEGTTEGPLQGATSVDGNNP